MIIFGWVVLGFVFVGEALTISAFADWGWHNGGDWKLLLAIALFLCWLLWRVWSHRRRQEQSLLGEIRALDREGRRRRFAEAVRTDHAYRLGELVLHSGDLLHQAAPGVALAPSDERFTLQGHALRRDGTWELYW